MIIEISDALTVGEIKEAFNNAFPFLTIEFYMHPHAWGKASAMNQQVDHDKTIAAVRNAGTTGAMEVHSWHKTGHLEQELSAVFGLHIQVFRRDGNAWVQTAATDSRTLQEQNDAASNASQELLDGTDNQFNIENPS